jgi:hypothetical protein
MEANPLVLRRTQTNGGTIRQDAAATWHLEIPPNPAGGPARPRYCLAQLDDYTGLARRAFRWQPPLHLSLRGRVSQADLPGTWGFGLWNDPFGLGLIGGVARLQLPTLPNAAWFFFASAHNYLSLRDDLPVNGALAACFRSPRLPGILLLLGAPGLPLLLWRHTNRLLRRLGQRFVHQEAASLAIDPTCWHTYTLEWQDRRLACQVDDTCVLDTSTAPQGPLGLVLWVDNQYAAFPPDRLPAFGTLPNLQAAWIEIQDLRITSP